MTDNPNQAERKTPMKHLDLFTGIGGFSIAAESVGFETVAFCEIDPEASIITRHFWPHVPNLTDIRTVTRDRYPHLVPDLITGGVPCQPASALGLMRGTSDERWLWPETIRLMREFRPSFGVFENPPALLALEHGDAWNGIVSGLVALGYDLWWDVFPAAAFGAGHLRERVILVCSDPDSINGRRGARREDRQKADNRRSEYAAEPNGSGRGARGTWRPSGDSEGASEQTLQLDPSYANGERRHEARNGIPSGEPRGNDVGRQSSAHDCKALASDPIGARLQRYSWNGQERDESRRDESGKGRPVTAPDLRGRVTGADWWHEAHTGIPVLATGIPSRVVEAVSRCVGNSVVPQAIIPVMEAIASTFNHQPQNRPDETI